MRNYYDELNEEYERGFRDGMRAGKRYLRDNYLNEEQTDAQKSWNSLRDKYKYWLKYREDDNGKNVFFFETDGGWGEFSVRLQVSETKDYFNDDDDVLSIDADSLVCSQFNYDRLYLPDVVRLMKTIRGNNLSEEGKKCRREFKRFLKDIQSKKFPGVKLDYSNLDI